MSEFSERAREVTTQVALYIANEGDLDPETGDGRIAERAARLAGAGDLRGLADYVTQIVKTYQGEAARAVRDELAVNDYDRIRWADVAEELAGD